MMSMGPEKTALHEFLEYQRASVLAVLAGLDEEALGTSVLPSGWTPLGLLEHLGHAERHWFQEVLTGFAAPLPWLDEVDTPLRTTRAPSAVFGFYRDQCAVSDSIIEATPLEAAPIGAHPDEILTSQTADLRRIMLHMIEETARHAGHLDAARELIDGRTVWDRADHRSGTRRSRIVTRFYVGFCRRQRSPPFGRPRLDLTLMATAAPAPG